MNTWSYYQAGVPVGDLRILKRLNGASRQAETFYIVRRLCCGEELEMSHHAIALRAKRGATQCKPCKREAARMGRKQKRVTLSDIEAASPWLRDASGYFWPYLGKMGARWGWPGPVRASALR